MNFANLDLCKELYELSGWVPEEQIGSYYIGGSGHYVKDAIATKDTPLQIPVYDLGYLMRKLPIYISQRYYPKSKIQHLMFHPSDSGRWTIYYTNSGFLVEADTPENATAKLVIELFKQGILPTPQTIKQEEK